MSVLDTTYTAITSREFPPAMRKLQQWMVTRDGEKRPYAPWTNPDAEAPCNKGSCDADTTAECDHSARYKWGWTGNYHAYQKIETARTVSYWDIEHAVFIMSDYDPFVFVDFDDVRNGDDVHPAAAALLMIFGDTYVSVSGSGEGVHAIYKGSLPDGIRATSWELDNEPWVDGSDDVPSVEFYEQARAARLTGHRVEQFSNTVKAWDQAVVDKVVGTDDETHDTRDDPPGREDVSDVPGVNDDTADTADSWGEVFGALDALDAQKVAYRTIVQSWNEDASTSKGNKAFDPTWGDSNGTANIVNSDTWLDTGDVGGSGGPVVMAAIDSALSYDEKDAKTQKLDGEEWVEAYEHLRELGFDVPELPSGDGDTNEYSEAVLRRHAPDDLGDVSENGEAALVAAVRARDAGDVSKDATPRRRVLQPLVEYLTGLPADHEAVVESSWSAAESAFCEVDEDDLREKGVVG